ncbi:hypothetical protein TNCV_2016301 [Trichonephila clavipes]|nr:hypothetical protein TNCV_2016301 [Trichonephila clavipes]
MPAQVLSIGVRSWKTAVSAWSWYSCTMDPNPSAVKDPSVEGLMHAKSIEAQIPDTGVTWKMKEWDTSSGVSSTSLDRAKIYEEVETDQAIEEPTEIMHINQDSEKVVIRCFSSAGSTGRGRTNTLPFTYPHRKKSQGDKSGCLGVHWVKGHVVVSGLTNPSVKEMFIEGISPVWWCAIQLENEVVNVVLQLYHQPKSEQIQKSSSHDILLNLRT